MSKNYDSSISTINSICEGTSIEGKVNSKRDIRIDGIIKGTLTTESKVVIGETGRVEGDIFCQNIDVSGTIEGNVTATELVSLKSSSKITGNIKTSKIAVETGSVFTGSCDMSNKPGKLPTNGEFKKKEKTI